MIDINIRKSDLQKIKKAMESVGKTEVKKMVAQAVNRAAKKTYSATSEPKGLSQLVREHLNIKAAQFKKDVKLPTKATPTRLSSKIQMMKTKRTNLVNFGASQNNKGVSYKIMKSGARNTAPGAFIAKNQVFRRVGKSRLPIIKLQGVSIWGWAIENQMDRDFQRTANKRLRLEMIEQRDMIIRRWG